MPDSILNGSMDHRLYNNINFTIPGIPGYKLHKILRPLIICSSGSACSNGEPSYVLQSIGRSLSEAQSSLRLSLGRSTTDEEIDEAIYLIKKSVIELRK